MLDRVVHRITFWGALSLISAALIVESAHAPAAPAFLGTAPVIGVLTLLVTVGGWRLLHRERQDRVAHDLALHEQVRGLQEAMHGSLDGICLLRAVRDESGALSDFEITDINARGAALLYGERRVLLGCRLRRDLRGGMGSALFPRYAAALTRRAPFTEETRVDRRYISASWLMHQVVPTSDGLAITLRDITVHKREERQLRRASLLDDLTQLNNRRGFIALAEQQLRTARRQGKDAVVLYADMDGFKHINDTYGHALGDRVLVTVARLLQDTVRDCDVVGRLGGDEFTILALDADGGGARAIQRRVDERLAVVNASGVFPLAIGLTVGFTRARPTDTAGISELLARADQLLYQRKRRRRLLETGGAPAVVLPKRTAQRPAARTGRAARAFEPTVPLTSPIPMPNTSAMASQPLRAQAG